MTICLKNEKKGRTAVRPYLVKSKNDGKFVLQLIYQSDEEKKILKGKRLKQLVWLVKIVSEISPSEL